MLAIYFLILQIICIQIFAYEVCPKYRCNNELTNDICAKIEYTKDPKTNEDVKKYELLACPSHKFKCDLSTLEKNQVAYCVANPKLEQIRTKQLPGNFCSKNTECLSSTCKNSRCIGKKIFRTCLGHEECDLGLFCHNHYKVCMPQKNQTETCIDDTECLNSLGCHFGVCTKYFSLAIDKEADDDMFCETGYMRNGKCAKGPKIRNKRLPYSCKRNSTYIEKCQYTESDGSTFFLDCECGVNFNGDSFCPLAKGDPEYLKYLEERKKIHRLNCHTLSRFQHGPCGDFDKSIFKNLKSSSWVYHMHHLLQNNDFCVKETIMAEFYHLSSSSSSIYMKFSLLFVIVLSFI